MNKLAETQHPIHPLLARRWSPRAFDSRPVERDKILSLLEAARWAPSSFNEQPWSFILATKAEPGLHEQLLSCMVEVNQQWARQAPVLMLSVAKLRFEKNGKENRHAFHDVGLAVETLVVEATSRELFVHQMAGFDAGRARTLFHIPEGHEAVAMIALGYIGRPESLPEPLRQREVAPRTRRQISEFVFGGEWGKKSDIV
ncbi:MAG TPA: nitroreductase family protein [Acidobacteriota bacterium]|jgi:nitroreductase